MQAAGQRADLVEPCCELVDGEVEQFDGLVGLCAQPPQAEEHRGDPLLRTVVEVALDALALGVGDLDQARARGAQLAVGGHAVGDVAQVAGEGRRARAARCA